MPFFRRMAKRGFKNTNFTVEFWTVNIGEILAHHDFKSGGKVDTDSLVKAQLVRDNTRPVKILGDMRGLDKVGVKLEVEVARVTDSVRAKITEAGGSINEIGTRRDEIRGVDRNTEDRKPTKLTKKLRRTSPKK
jgi:ribosomal protein L15